MINFWNTVNNSLSETLEKLTMSLDELSACVIHLVAAQQKPALNPIRVQHKEQRFQRRKR